MKDYIKQNLQKLFEAATKDEILLDGLVIYFYGFPGVSAVFTHKISDLEYYQTQINRILFQAIKEHSDLKYNSKFPFEDEEVCLEKLWFAFDRESFVEDLDWIRDHLQEILSQQKFKPKNNLNKKSRVNACFLGAVLGYIKNSKNKKSPLLEIDSFDKFVNFKIPFLPLWEILKELGKIQKEKIDNNYSLWELCDCLIELNFGYWIPQVSANAELLQYDLKLNSILLNDFIQNKISADFTSLISVPMKKFMTIYNNSRNIFYWRNAYFKNEKDVYMKNHQNSSLYISDHVRRAVWIRDNGKCVSCGAERTLFYKILNQNEKLIKSNLKIICVNCSKMRTEEIHAMTRRISNYERKIIEQRYDHRCAKCGHVLRRSKNKHIDHIIPFEQGGATIVKNLQLYCDYCNLKKSNYIDL